VYNSAGDSNVLLPQTYEQTIKARRSGKTSVLPRRIIASVIPMTRIALISDIHANEVALRAVLAEIRMPPEQPQIPRLRHRMLGHRRRIVGIRQSRGPLGQQILQFQVAKPGQR
jgi:hypothetical protein